MKIDFFQENGYQIIDNVYSDIEIDTIINMINSHKKENTFGVREFLLNKPKLIRQLFSNQLIAIINKVSPDCDSLIKSIYFDKPPTANWVVNWHQDLTINLKSKSQQKGFKNWRKNSERTVVQPCSDYLENIFTIRIHLDDCDERNGALRVIEKSHKKGVIPITDWVNNQEGKEKICKVKRGGVLLMKPLILHSSKRTKNLKNRRVIHLEFIDKKFSKELNWKECVFMPKPQSPQPQLKNS